MYRSDALPYTRGTRTPRLLGMKNYLNNYFVMYKTSDALPNMRGTHLRRLLGVGNYLNNYFFMYTRLTRARIRVDLASPAYLGLGII